MTISVSDNYKELDEYFHAKGIKRPLLVCGKSIERFPLWDYFQAMPQRLGVVAERFSDFTPNPAYESVVEGIARFRKENCDSVIAVGGGSAMDTAKCIKLYANMDGSSDYVTQSVVSNSIPLVAIPTTAGTGSEATRYAVIYYKGEKLSVTHNDCIPSAVVFDPSLLETLPLYQRKVTMLDALCHAIESYWSVNSNDESKKYAEEALRMILANIKEYMANMSSGNANMLRAANLAGKAINITQTTAGHAMSYKLTSLYGMAHGHSVAVCVYTLWPYMLGHTSLCVDSRGEEYLKSMFAELAAAMDCRTPEDAAGKYQTLFDSLDLERPVAKDEDYDMLKTSVNPVRLKNHPIKLDEETIDKLYHDILK